MKKWNIKTCILWGIILFFFSVFPFAFAETPTIENSFTNTSSKIEYAKIEHMNQFVDTRETIFYIIK